MRRGIQAGPESVDPIEPRGRTVALELPIVRWVLLVFAVAVGFAASPAHATITDDITPFHATSPAPAVGDDSQYHATGIQDGPDPIEDFRPIGARSSTRAPGSPGWVFVRLPFGGGVYWPLDFCGDFPQAPYCVHQRGLAAQTPAPPAPAAPAPCPPPPGTHGIFRSGTGPGSSDIPR